MIIKNILTGEFNHKLAQSLQKSLQAQSVQKIDVTHSVIHRGDYAIRIGDYSNQYNVDEFDTLVVGDASKIELITTPEFANILLIHANHNNTALVPMKTVQDTNVTDYKLQIKGDTNMIEKVVGTSFSFKANGDRHYTQFSGTDFQKDGIPSRKGQALLVPEPDNQYDANAVAVIAKMADGSPFHLGYLKKGGELYQKVTTPITAVLTIIAYSEGGDYNDSYTVEVSE